MLPAAKIKEYTTVVILLLITTILSMLQLSAIALLCSACSIALLGFLCTRFHYGYVGAAVMILLVVCTIFSGTLSFALVSLLPAVLCGLTLGIGYNLKIHPLKTIAIFTAVYVLNFIGNLKLASTMSDENVLISAIESVGNTYRELFAASNLPMATEELNTLISEITATMLQFLPAFIVMICFIYALFCFYLFKRICGFRKAALSPLPSFADWHLQKSIGIIYFILLVGSFLLPEGNLYTDVILNIVTVMTSVFYVLGLAYIEYLLKKSIIKSTYRKLILLLIIFSVFLTAGMTFFVISIIGVMDSIIDYRTRKTPHQ